jgi:hypothetical protein
MVSSLLSHLHPFAGFDRRLPSTIPRRHIAEAAGRVTRADKARGECVECVAAVEIAVAAGDAIAKSLAAVVS